MIGSCMCQSVCLQSIVLLMTGKKGVWAGTQYRRDLFRLWLLPTQPAKDGKHIWDILASFLYTGSKWRCVIYLCIQSMV